MDDKITYKDVEEYKSLFTLAPSFLLGTMIRRNSNLVKKFESKVKSFLVKLTPEQVNKLNIILASDVSELQEVMKVAYKKTRKKQYKLLAEPKAKEFIKKNLSELEILKNKLNI